MFDLCLWGVALQPVVQGNIICCIIVESIWYVYIVWFRLWPPSRAQCNTQGKNIKSMALYLWSLWAGLILRPQDLVNPVLIYNKPRVLPSDHEECIQGDTEVLVVNLGDVLDVDPHTDRGLRLIGQVELGVVLGDADGVALGADRGLQDRLGLPRQCRRHAENSEWCPGQKPKISKNYEKQNLILFHCKFV